MTKEGIKCSMDAENKRGMLKIKTKQKRGKFKFV